MPSFTPAPCARSTEGIAIVAAPAAAVVRSWRRLNFLRPDMSFPNAFVRFTCRFLAYILPHLRQARLVGARSRDTMNEPQTLFDRLWASHEITRREDGAALLWVDRHYVHEGSFHAFAKMKERGRSVAEPGLTFGVADHYVPTRGRDQAIANPEIAAMVRNLEANTSENRITLFSLRDPRQGIVHVVGPEQGLTLPGLLIVC